MTDNEISQAWELCMSGKEEACNDCPYFTTGCIDDLHRDSASLIKRQQDEIERLEKCNLREAMTFNAKTIKEAAVEEVRLFLNDLKERAFIAQNEWSHGEHPKVVEWDDILAVFDERFGDVG